AMVRAKIMGEWIIPPSFLEEGAPPLNARLEVRVDYDGEIASALWVARSGNAGFDASCTRAVQRASPLPKPPDRLALEVYNEGFLIEFDPRLKP
ncbi:MAG: TonB C-terminal domain-containing protein, partial [Deltaproteobacteria bacterium]|nr:TonB C-terminal domain-containing protein [Deltaproteobacteria bacterium]